MSDKFGWKPGDIELERAEPKEDEFSGSLDELKGFLDSLDEEESTPPKGIPNNKDVN